MPRLGGRLGGAARGVVVVAFSAAMLVAGYEFFMYSLGYLSANPPHVTAGLMAGLAGFTFTAAAAGLLRDWVVGEKLASALEEAERELRRGGGQ